MNGRPTVAWTVITGGLYGALIAICGFSVPDWQFWVLMSAFCLIRMAEDLIPWRQRS